MGRKSSPNAGLELSVSQLSDALGLDRATLNKRLGAAGANYLPGPKGAKLYRLHDAIRACLPDFLGSNEPGTFDEARTREMKARAQLQELELAVRRGQLLPVDDVQKVWEGHVASARSRLLSIGPSLAPVLKVEDEEAQCRTLIDRAIHDAIDELAGDFDEDDSGPADGAEGVEVPNDSDGKRVGRSGTKAKRGSER